MEPRPFQAVHFAFPTKSNPPGFGLLHGPSFACIDVDEGKEEKKNSSSLQN